MKKLTKTADFFLSTNAPQKFFSLAKSFDTPIDGERRFLLKGSAGSGKSTAMKRIVSGFMDREDLIERIHCSSDPDSLDGVILYKACCSIADATPPHEVEPEYPASFQTVCDLWNALSEEKLTPRLHRIEELNTAISASHAKCRRLLASADLLLQERRRIAEVYTDFDAAERFAHRLAAKSFPKTGDMGVFRDRLLSAFTMHGVLTYTHTPKTLCSKTVCIDDPFGLIGDSVLRILSEEAKNNGHTVYRCFHPLAPDRLLAAVLVPTCDTAFLVRSKETPWTGYTADRTVRFGRFTDETSLRTKRKELRFLQKTADTVLFAASEQLKEAKRLHDLLEEQHRDAIDFSYVDRQTEELIRKIEKRYT